MSMCNLKAESTAECRAYFTVVHSHAHFTICVACIYNARKNPSRRLVGILLHFDLYFTTAGPA